MNFLPPFLHRWLNRPEALEQPIRYRQLRYVVDIGDAQTPRGDELVIVGTDDQPKWAVLACPCGCGHVLNVNLMRTHRPHWIMIRQPDGTISLLPSLWVRDVKCRSHFFVYRSRIIWAGEYDESTTPDWVQ